MIFRAFIACGLAAVLAMGCAKADSGSTSGGDTKSTGTTTGDTKGSTAKKAQIRSVTGTLKNLPAGKTVTITGKTNKGKLISAIIDPKTKKWTINLPKGEKAAMVLKLGDILRKFKFTKGLKKGDSATDDTDYSIPDSPFTGDADLGSIDASGDGGAGDMTIGDGADENSIFKYSDADGDGKSDLDDPTDTSWMNADESWEAGAGFDDPTKWFEGEAGCDIETATELCKPPADQFFSESDCSKEGAADWCYSEGDPGYYTEPPSETWWDPNAGGEGTGSDTGTDMPDVMGGNTGMDMDIGMAMPDVSNINCLDTCTKTCPEGEAHAMCVSACESECGGS